MSPRWRSLFLAAAFGLLPIALATFAGAEGGRVADAGGDATSDAGTSEAGDAGAEPTADMRAILG